MGKKVKPNQLGTVISSILDDYGDRVRLGLTDAVKQVAKAGVKELRRVSKRLFKGSGAYARGWTSVVETGGHSAQGTIYNKDLPGLPHLLEHGHLNRDGSRTSGMAHIAPVEEEIIRSFAEEVEKSL